ncbi:MAG: hypothetical protein Kow00105_10340 [Phycisphaeraceae bacterium]
MAKLVCLANSRKNANRCIAGLTDDGVWIRPVSTLSDGGITRSMRQVDGQEPELLDVLSIPLAKTGPDFGHQPENRSVAKGLWTRMGKLKSSQVIKLCEKRNVLLHTDSDRVSVQMITALAPADRYSLQLIQVPDAEFYRTTSIRGKRQYRAHFTYSGDRYDIVVTDPVAEAKLGKDEKLSSTCILTVSMGGPYDGNYFKFIAAVIELGD